MIRVDEQIDDGTWWDMMGHMSDIYKEVNDHRSHAMLFKFMELLCA